MKASYMFLVFDLGDAAPCTATASANVGGRAQGRRTGPPALTRGREACRGRLMGPSESIWAAGGLFSPGCKFLPAAGRELAADRNKGLIDRDADRRLPLRLGQLSAAIIRATVQDIIRSRCRWTAGA